VCVWESSAVAQAAMQSGAARLKMNIDSYREQLAQKFSGQYG
jgi:hypothetical protein